MDNTNDTNYLLEFDVPGQPSCSSGYEKFNNISIAMESSHIACFCCLATNVPVVNASKCNHTEFVKIYFKMQHASGLWICCICHYMLKKIELFRFQVCKSFNHLRKKTPEGDNDWKLVNDLTKRSNVSILSIVKHETDEYTDPLRVSNTIEPQEIEIKYEPEYNIGTYETDSTPALQFDRSSEIFTNIQTNEPIFTSCDTTVPHTETSQNLNLMKMINLTPLRPQKRENPLLKTMLSTEGPFSIQNYIKILPKQDSLVKNKGPNTMTLKDAHTDNKLASTQEKQRQNLVSTKNIAEAQEIEDEKLYSLLHKPSSVIDSTYEGKIMQCNITKEQLEQERENERNTEPFKSAKYKCNSCVRVFSYEFEMDRHNARQHRKPYISETMCTICKSVYSKATYKPHFNKHFKRFVCVVCNENSTDLPKLALHFNQSHPEKEPIPLSYWCNECDFKTDEILKYRQHRKTHRTQKCNICNRIIYVKMRIHMKSHHSTEAAAKKKRAKKPTKSYKCDHCDRIYVLPSTLRNHVRMCHSADTNTYYCEKCDKQFKTETIYRVHLSQSSAHASIEEVFKYICDYCGKKTKYKDVMESHIEREHLKTERFRCEPCNKIFGSNKFLQRHINFVHNKHKLPKNKICQYCGKAFAVVATLRTHIRTHTGERPLKCDICDMTFAYNASLYTHRRLKHKIPRKRELEALQNDY